jgi:hypothetical protein
MTAARRLIEKGADIHAKTEVCNTHLYMRICICACIICMYVCMYVYASACVFSGK